MSDVGDDDGEHQVQIPGWKVLMFQLFTVLSYANSAVNPLLYVFVNDNFRQNCLAAAVSIARGGSQVRGVGTPTSLAAAGAPRSGHRPVVVVQLSATSAAAAGVASNVELHAIAVMTTEHKRRISS